MRDRDYRKRSTAAALCLGVIVMGGTSLLGQSRSGVIFAAILALNLGLFLWFTRPGVRRDSTSHASAQQAASDNDVIVYWQPDCIYCDLLKSGLGRTRDKVLWVNIVEDPEAAEFVASYHNGDQTVPTAITGAGEMIPATPRAIKAHLDG